MALSALAYGGLFAFISGSSFVLQGVYGLTELPYAFSFAFMVLGFIGGTFLAQRVVGRLGLDGTIGLGVGALALGGATMLALVAFGTGNLIVRNRADGDLCSRSRAYHAPGHGVRHDAVSGPGGHGVVAARHLPDDLRCLARHRARAGARALGPAVATSDRGTGLLALVLFLATGRARGRPVAH